MGRALDPGASSRPTCRPVSATIPAPATVQTRWPFTSIRSMRRVCRRARVVPIVESSAPTPSAATEVVAAASRQRERSPPAGLQARSRRDAASRRLPRRRCGWRLTRLRRRQRREGRAATADRRRPGPRPRTAPRAVALRAVARARHQPSETRSPAAQCVALAQLTKARSPLFHQLRHDTPRMPRLAFSDIVSELSRVLVALGFAADRARASATLFAETHRDGVATHGLNRFPRFVRQIKAGRVNARRLACPGGPLRTLGAVGRAARPGEPERDGSDGSGDRARA